MYLITVPVLSPNENYSSLSMATNLLITANLGRTCDHISHRPAQFEDYVASRKNPQRAFRNLNGAFCRDNH